MASSSNQFYLCFRKLLVLILLLVIFLSDSVSSEFIESQRKQSLGMRRRMLKLDTLERENGDEVVQQQTKKKINLLATKNQTKLVKPTIKNSSKNSTTTITHLKTHVKKLNSTSNSTKNSSNLTKISTLKNKTQFTITPKKSSEKKPTEIKSKNPEIKTQFTEKKTQKKPIISDWMDFNDDFVSEFRDLPTKFHQTLLPDLEKMSITSKAYIFKANKEITEGFKPFVGNKYASTIASIISCIFILIPLILVSLIFHKFKSYFSLQKILIFIQVYLSIYFSILSLSSLLTGLEPLNFFYTISRSSYVGLQVLQTFGYVFYLLLLIMYLVVIFSVEMGLGFKLLGLVQTIVGFSVGLHYYVNVFHRAILHQSPKTSWKVHGIYATCFLVICVLDGAHRRKKAYLEDGGDEGKKS